jgi:hypothetical protein
MSAILAIYLASFRVHCGRRFVFNFGNYPILAISAISFVALCLRPSATTPTPHRALLKTKAKVPFDRAVDRAVEPFFLVFHDSNPVQFQPCFLVFAVRSAEGHKSRNALAEC